MIAKANGTVDSRTEMAELRRTADGHGIEVETRDLGRGGSIHVMFNADGRRLLDFWPSNCTATSSGCKGKADDVWSALDIAVAIKKGKPAAEVLAVPLGGVIPGPRTNERAAAASPTAPKDKAPAAGRTCKTTAPGVQARPATAKLVSDRDLKRLGKKLLQMGLAGDLAAADLVLRYSAGNPEERQDAGERPGA